MGIYDREYYRDEQPRGFTLGHSGGQSMVVKLILVTVGVFLLDLFSGGWLTAHLALTGHTLLEPWNWWKFLTYGFLHDDHNIQHILFNMLVLFFFARDVEGVYGQREFLWFYLTAIVVSGAVWAMVAQLDGTPLDATVVGASGAVTAAVVMFILLFPHRTVLLFFVLPVPAWVMGVLILLFDFFGATRGGTNVAHSAHLAGAAFAFIYQRSGWRLSRFAPDAAWLQRMRGSLKRRPKLRLHDPDAKDARLREEVDRLLEKVYRDGEASLTPAERRKLEQASRHFQKRRG